MRILYIAGCGRSGSTILQNILGELPGFFPAGEICSLAKRYRHRSPCSCGKSLDNCDFWVQTLARAFGSFDSVSAGQLQRVLRSLRTRHLPALLTARGRRRVLSGSLASQNVIEQLYQTIQRESGSSVIIDSSKDPLYGFVLAQIPSFDVSFLHLIRDSRAVAFSERRKRLIHPRNNCTYQSSSHSLKSALMWNAWNVAAATLLRRLGSRYCRVFYEDLVRNPIQVCSQILNWLREPTCSLPFVSDERVRLHPNHAVGGSPLRFQTGFVEVKADDEWKTAMSGSRYGLVTALTWPLMDRFGYAVLGRGHPSDLLETRFGRLASQAHSASLRH